MSPTVERCKCTHQSIEHLVEHRSQTPPVHCAVVRLLLEDLRSQVLRAKRQQCQNVSQQMLVHVFICPSYLWSPAERSGCTVGLQALLAEAKVC